MEQRIAFMETLAERSLPMPQGEGQWHASRVFVDHLNRSVYSVEQWVDYLQIQGYSIRKDEKELLSDDYSTCSSVSRSPSMTTERASPTKRASSHDEARDEEQSRQFKILADHAVELKGSVIFMRQTFLKGDGSPALVVVTKRGVSFAAWFTVRMLFIRGTAVVDEPIQRCLAVRPLQRPSPPLGTGD